MLGICSLNVLVVHEILLVPVVMFGSETMLWKKERSRIRIVQKDNFRGLLRIRRMNRVLNAQIRELCGVKKGLEEWIDKGLLHWFSHVSGIAKRVHVGVCW